VCGTTGEGESLSAAERSAIAEAYVAAAAGRLPVLVQVGHNSYAQARELAAHAQRIGADGISALGARSSFVFL
jgi:N-acetylneuraminate lyase